MSRLNFNAKRKTTFGFFSKIAELGVVEAPEDYCHARRLSTFQSNGVRIADPLIETRRFGTPSDILRPGTSLKVDILQHDVSKDVSVGTCLRFFDTEKGVVYPGVQGLTLVWEQKRDLLPRGFELLSLDRMQRLPVHPKTKEPMVAALRVLKSGAAELIVLPGLMQLGKRTAFFCFTKV